jgi:hypothetical protein
LCTFINDDIYDGNRNESTWKLADFNMCRKVIFDDTSTPDEIAMSRGKKVKPTKLQILDFSVALMSKFDVKFNKQKNTPEEIKDLFLVI